MVYKEHSRRVTTSLHQQSPQILPIPPALYPTPNSKQDFKMAFFSCNSNLAPLLQLLDPPRRPTCTRTFTPAFDVRELADGYYLDGELPGVDPSQIDIEFSDSHTLVIKGRTDRDSRNQMRQTRENPPSSSPYQPTVEDEDESEGSGSESDGSLHSTDGPSKPVADQAQPPSFRYWASERSIGQFQRTFTFSTRVDQDGVRANLKNGILSLVVPKEIAPQTKKIRIQ